SVICVPTHSSKHSKTTSKPTPSKSTPSPEGHSSPIYHPTRLTNSKVKKIHEIAQNAQNVQNQ
ncbi:11218_t:CDS:1, partial [Diversispora eburnea]